MIGKTLSVQPCPPCMPLLALFFLVVESFRKVLAISLLFPKLSYFPYLARFARWQIENQMVCIDLSRKLVVASCPPVCHNSGSLFAGSVCPLCFDLAPRHGSDLKPGPVNACHLTRHAADGGYVPRFLAFV